MKRLWVAAALAPLSFAASATAQTTPPQISTATTTPVATATFNAGKPADIVIVSGGSISPTTGGTAAAQLAAATLNSNNNVTNGGVISFKDLNYTTGILGLGGFTGNISSTGSITLNETATLPINSTNGIAYGPFATGTNRFGIQVAGSGALIGDVSNSGTITIVGENSAGILIGPGGLTGVAATGFTNGLGSAGAITVTGDNSFGIHSQGLITGNVSLGGTLNVTGQNSVGVALDQGATGNVDIQSQITVTGFHSLSAPTTTNLLKSLVPSQLLPGGPAVSIGGSVGGGVTIDAQVAASAAGVTPVVAAAAAGSITAYGSTALQIGGSSPMTIGAGASGASLLVGGTVTSNGVYQNFNATGIQVGAANGAAVSLPGGIDITGSVTASTISTSLTATDGAGNPIAGTATGLHLLAGASVGGITIGSTSAVGGGLAASSTSSLTSGPGNSVTALQIDAGAVGGITLNNYSTISASIGGIAAVIGGAPAAGGVVGTATAVSDQAGAISFVNNTGAISATITPIVPIQTETGSTIALDLSHNTTGVTVTQTQAAVIPATATAAAITPAAPSITGDVLFGSGAASLNLEAGTLAGNVTFGSNTLNRLDIENGATMVGALNETAGGLLALSVGTNGANANTSTLNMLTTSHVGLSNLNVGANGVVDFTIDPRLGQGGEFNVAGSANLAAGAKIGLNLLSITPTSQTYTLITTTGSLTSGATDQSLLGPTPFLFNTTINTTTGPAGSVSVTVAPRTPAQLGLNQAETAAYNAIFSQLSLSNLDAGVAADVLSKQNRSDFIHIYDQFLPDFEGGPFDSLVAGQQQIARAQADAPIKLQTDDVRGWVQEIGFLDNRQDSSSANGYRASGFGIVGGIERARGESAVGVSAAFLTDGVKDDRQGPGSLVSSEALEVGAYWRDGSVDEGLNLHASVNGGYVYLSNTRLLFDETASGVATLFREAKSQWNGATVSAEFGASYQIPMGRFYVRPEVIADYILLYESAFNEHGGGVSEDLGVAARTSQEGTVLGDLVVGADLGGVNHWRPELTLGWRQIVTGGPGDTTAHFLSGGSNFTLSPQAKDRGSLIARVGVRAGGNFADFSADAGGELSNAYQVYNARAVARFLF